MVGRSLRHPTLRHPILKLLVPALLALASLTLAAAGAPNLQRGPTPTPTATASPSPTICPPGSLFCPFPTTTLPGTLPACLLTPTNSTVDSDGDGLPDVWERCGVWVDTPGGKQFVNLPAMGADPNKPDIFIQLDYMQDATHSQKILPAAIKKVVDAFAASPHVSPTGSHGINLHVDEGPDSILNFATNATWGSLSRAGTTGWLPLLGPIGFGAGYDWSAFQAIKDQRFTPTGRTPIFHYAIAAYAIDGRGTSGIARGIPSSDFILSLGQFGGGAGTVQQQAGTLMHELGHNLGLHHGGGDDENFKPNYLSVMNYLFQVSGLNQGSGIPGQIGPGALAKGGVLDYSRATLPALNETALNEPTGLGFGASGFATRHFCPGKGWVPVLDASKPIDWNCDGDSTDAGVTFDVNGNICVAPDFFGALHTTPQGDDQLLGTLTGKQVIVDGANRTCDTTASDGDEQSRPVGAGEPNILRGAEDWSHLIFNGGAIGGGGIAPAMPAVTELDILTPAIDQLILPYDTAEPAASAQPGSSQPGGATPPAGPPLPPGPVVSYPAGWNIVAGPPGTSVAQALGPLYSFQAGDGDYETLANSASLAPGRGYWAYFPEATAVMLSGDGPSAAEIPAQTGQWVMIGNPSATETLPVAGADAVLAFDPTTQEYVPVTTLAPGQGAWAISLAGGTISIGR